MDLKLWKILKLRLKEVFLTVPHPQTLQKEEENFNGIINVMDRVVYPDGSPVVVGDIVWNNEGVNVRKVIEVISPQNMEDACMSQPGFFWSRYIGEKDLGILGYESVDNFRNEGIGKLSLVELLCLKLLFRQLGQELGLTIWGNSNYLYYPVLYPERETSGKFRWAWYLFFQPYHSSIQSFEDEQCYRFDEKSNTFQRVDRAIQDQVRGL